MSLYLQVHVRRLVSERNRLETRIQECDARLKNCIPQLWPRSPEESGIKAVGIHLKKCPTTATDADLVSIDGGTAGVVGLCDKAAR